MQSIAFLAQFLGVIFIAVGAPTALFCLLNALLDRNVKMLTKILLPITLWVALIFLYSRIVPSGETRAIQYTGIAGIAQILFVIANFTFLRYFLKILRQQQNAST